MPAGDEPWVAPVAGSAQHEVARIAAEGVDGARSGAVGCSVQREEGLVVEGRMGPKALDAAWTAPL